MAKTFFVILRQLPLPMGEGEEKLVARAAAKLGCRPEEIESCQPLRRSLDARKRHKKPRWIYHVRLELPAGWRKRLKTTPGLDIEFEKRTQALFETPPDPAFPQGKRRPLVVGAGPAGLFAALRLARAGWRPLLVERGDGLEERRRAVAAFWRSGRLDPESNPLFGIGGAGLFSDGKLNTRHKDREGIRTVLQALVDCGAPEDILVDAEPHLGSDLLSDVADRLLGEIVRLGGEARWRCRLDRLLGENGALRQAELSSPGGREVVDTDACVLAVGHSARDVYEMLHREGVPLQAKPFAVGLRAEMPQTAINASQLAGKRDSGGAAMFRMSRPPQDDALSCYTFCMCPGGLVIACASEPEMLSVNGMSYHARAGDWGNAAFLAPVTVEDFAVAGGNGLEPDSPLAGVGFQRHWERANYRAGLPGGPYAIPASSLAAFVKNEAGTLPEARGSARAVAANLRELLPARIADTLASAIPAMVSRLRKVDPESVVLYGIETRTSSPVRILRGDDGASPGLAGLFPAGEGAGYAGGITTSALDGWRAAGRLMEMRAENG